MNALNQLSGFWRLWIALSVLWVVGVYVEEYWWEISQWFSPYGDPFDDLPVLDGCEGSAAECRALLRRMVSDAAKDLSEGGTRTLSFNEAKVAYFRMLLLRAFGPPIAALALAGLARWIGSGIKRSGS